MKKILPFIIVAAVAVTFSCCARKPSQDTRVLAQVSNKSITVQDLKSRIAKLPPYYQEIVNKNMKRFLDETVMEMIFYEEAVRNGLEKDREVKEVLEAAKKKILITKLIKTEVEDKIKINESELRKFYEEHKEDFKTPELWRASHILVSTEKESNDIMDELSKGANFEELARTRSIDATATRGGDVGYFRAGQVVPEFEKTCLGLKVGEMSGIVHTEFGYHIIKLTDKKEPGPEPFERVRRKIEDELKKEKRGELFDKLVSELKDKYKVTIKEDVFKTLEPVNEEKKAVKE